MPERDEADRADHPPQGAGQGRPLASRAGDPGRLDQARRWRGADDDGGCDLDVARTLHRVTLIGEVPVGPDGRESELIEGVPFRSAPVFDPATS